MSKHKYSVEDKAEVKIAIIHMTNLRNKIETDGEALTRIDDLIYGLQEFLEEISN